MWVVTLHSLFLYPDPSLTVAHLPNGTANFEPNPFSYNTPTFPNLIHSSHNHLPMKMEQTECSKTSANKIQTPGNNPEESIQQSTICLHSAIPGIPQLLCNKKVHYHVHISTSLFPLFSLMHPVHIIHF